MGSIDFTITVMNLGVSAQIGSQSFLYLFQTYIYIIASHLIKGLKLSCNLAFLHI